MDVLYRLGRATAAEILGELPDAPSYSAVRAKLRVLEEKGQVRHRAEELRYVYVPTLAPERARQSALRHLIDTFFNGSTEQVMAALIGKGADKATDDELARMSALIAQARREGR